jgi:hypothetical protein
MNSRQGADLEDATWYGNEQGIQSLVTKGKIQN